MLTRTTLTLGPDTGPFSILDTNRRQAAWEQWFADLFHQAGYAPPALRKDDTPHIRTPGGSMKQSYAPLQ
jgi:hypothetical protein